MLLAIEKSEAGKPGFVAIKVLDSLAKVQVIDLAQCLLQPGTIFSTDAFVSLSGLGRAGYPRRRDQTTGRARPVAALGAHRHRQLQAFHCSAPSVARYARIARRSTSMSSSTASTAARGGQIPNRLLALCVQASGTARCGTVA